MTQPDDKQNHTSPVTWRAADNTVKVTAEYLTACDMLPAIEAICMTMAQADPLDNPCGLFCHPLTEAETTLLFGADPMLHQQALAHLIEACYLACNYPLHIRIETAATAALTPELAEQVKRHLTPQTQGGYADDDRPAPSWEWRCYNPQASSGILDSYRTAGGSVVLSNGKVKRDD